MPPDFLEIEMPKSYHNPNAIERAAAPYVDSNLDIMEPDSDFTDVLAEFESNSSIIDGVSGKKRIDTTFENTSIANIQHPRSEGTYNEIPDDEKRYRYPNREL